MKAPLPIAKPCQANWQDMTGDEGRRLCAQCDKHVHNLSALTPRQLKRFVERREGTECIGYEFREDGTIVTASSWGWLWNWMRPLRRDAAWVLAALMPSIFGGCATERSGPSVGGRVMAGTPPPETRTARKGGDGQMVLGEIAPPKKK